MPLACAQARFAPGLGRSAGTDVDATPAVVLKATVGAGVTFGGLEAPHTFNPLATRRPRRRMAA